MPDRPRRRGRSRIQARTPWPCWCSASASAGSCGAGGRRQVTRAALLRVRPTRCSTSGDTGGRAIRAQAPPHWPQVQATWAAATSPGFPLGASRIVPVRHGFAPRGRHFLANHHRGEDACGWARVVQAGKRCACRHGRAARMRPGVWRDGSRTCRTGTSRSANVPARPPRPLTACGLQAPRTGQRLRTRGARHSPNPATAAAATTGSGSVSQGTSNPEPVQRLRARVPV